MCGELKMSGDTTVPDWNEVKCPHCKKSMRFDATICPYCQTPATPQELTNRKSEHKAGLIGCGAIVVLAILGLAYCSPRQSDQPERDATNASAPLSNSTTATTQSEANKPTGPVLSPAQQNAVRSAKQYLSFQPFSRVGLIEQLSSSAGEGYEKADATTAVNSLTVDWNENASKAAARYLEISGFSCKGLIDQLKSDAGDGYTADQAKHGAKSAGAC
jgi:hypothetical protein